MAVPLFFYEKTMTVTTNKIQGMRLIIKGFSLMGVKVQNQNGNRPTDIDLKNPDKIPEEIIIQNRNRAGKASIEQMKKISAKPDYDRLSPTKDFGSGAPIVAYGNVPPAQKGKIDKAVMTDGTKYTIQYAVVEADSVLTSNDINGATNQEFKSNDASRMRAIAGNGRITGLEDAYRRGTASTYREDLIADCRSFGVSAKIIEKMKKPILVRIMQPKDVTADIGDRSNRQTGLGMNAVEQANNDMNRMDFNKVRTYDDGSLTIDALAEFVQKMPEEERGNLIDAEGNPTKQAEDRANAAVFAKAYNSDELTKLKAMALEPDAKSIINGLSIAAPAMTKLVGLPDGYDIRDIIAKAANLALQANRKGWSLEKMSAETDMFAGADDNEASREILMLFARNRRSAKAIGDKLIKMCDGLVNEAGKIGNNLFGDNLEKISRTDIIRQAMVMDGVTISDLAKTAWSVYGGEAMRWLLYGNGERPAYFFDGLSEIATRETY